MIFSWLRRRRRNKLLAEPFPTAWRDVLDAIPHVAALAQDCRLQHQATTQIVLGEKTFEGCGGLDVTDPMRVTIAGLASLMILGMPDDYFDNVHTILLYPDAYTVPQRVPIAPDVALEDVSDRLGEAHYRGPVILAWAEIEEDIREPWCGRNLVFHEFAHQLDMRNGEADGVPDLPRALQAEWAEVMAVEFTRLQRASRRRRDTLIDPYGASEPAEFFAVVTESFFDAPIDLKRNHRRLYDLLCRYYRRDPATALGDRT